MITYIQNLKTKEIETFENELPDRTVIADEDNDFYMIVNGKATIGGMMGGYDLSDMTGVRVLAMEDEFGNPTHIPENWVKCKTRGIISRDYFARADWEDRYDRVVVWVDARPWILK